MGLSPGGGESCGTKSGRSTRIHPLRKHQAPCHHAAGTPHPTPITVLSYLSWALEALIERPTTGSPLAPLESRGEQRPLGNLT